MLDPTKIMKLAMRAILCYIFSLLIGVIIYGVNMTILKDETATIVATIAFFSLLILTQLKGNNKQ